MGMICEIKQFEREKNIQKVINTMCLKGTIMITKFTSFNWFLECVSEI